MTEKVNSDLGKLIIDLLIGFERLQYSFGCDKVDNPNSIYLLYSSVLKLISRVISAENRDSRLFRLKYHHILSNDSVDEYLFHCLSKILSDLLEIENNYQRFIQPVAELHQKLMSILTNIQMMHERIVMADRRVALEVEKRRKKSNAVPTTDSNSNATTDRNTCFKSIYFLPTSLYSKHLKKFQTLTWQAVNSYYSTNHSLNGEIVEMLIDFDNAFAEFELEFVCQVNKTSIFTSHTAELTMDVAVMFSEAIQWAHGVGLLEYRPIGDCDIEIMVGIPRIAVLFGCGIATNGPLSDWSLNCRNDFELDRRLAPVFQNYRQELCRLRRQLNVLNAQEVNYLGRLLMNHNDLPLITTADGRGQDGLSSFKARGSTIIVSGDMHALFKLVSSVSDQMQSQHASDYRFFMETAFKLYKDESDNIESVSSSVMSNTMSSSDLFSNRYENVFSCFSNIDEAVDALTFTISEQYTEDNCTDLSFLSQWDPKRCQSPARANSDYSIHQTSPVLHNSSQIQDSNLQLIRPKWRADSFFPRCCHCDRTFNVFRRRHHCRRCGYLFCNSCWGTKLALPTFGIHNRVSICVECEEFLNGKGIQPTTSTQSAS